MPEKIRFKKVKGYSYCWEIQKKNKFFGIWYTFDEVNPFKKNPTYEELMELFLYDKKRTKGNLKFIKIGENEYVVEKKSSFICFESWNKKGKITCDKENPSVEDLIESYNYKEKELILLK